MIVEILKSIMASDTACRYLGRRAEALSLSFMPMPVSYPFLERWQSAAVRYVLVSVLPHLGY